MSVAASKNTKTGQDGSAPLSWYDSGLLFLFAKTLRRLEEPQWSLACTVILWKRAHVSPAHARAMSCHVMECRDLTIPHAMFRKFRFRTDAEHWSCRATLGGPCCKWSQRSSIGESRSLGDTASQCRCSSSTTCVKHTGTPRDGSKTGRVKLQRVETSIFDRGAC